MQIELSKKEFRRLLDLVYIGNWILNSTRGDDRIEDYDNVESKLFALCRENGMQALVEKWNGDLSDANGNTLTAMDYIMLLPTPERNLPAFTKCSRKATAIGYNNVQ